MRNLDLGSISGSTHYLKIHQCRKRCCISFIPCLHKSVHHIIHRLILSDYSSRLKSHGLMYISAKKGHRAVRLTVRVKVGLSNFPNIVQKKR